MSSDEDASRRKTTFSLSQELWDLLREESERTGQPQGRIIEEALQLRLSMTAPESQSLEEILRDLGWPYGLVGPDAPVKF